LTDNIEHLILEQFGALQNQIEELHIIIYRKE
jgi:hypothetical protein